MDNDFNNDQEGDDIHSEPMYIDSESDYMFQEFSALIASNSLRQDKAVLPEFPTCPGDLLTPHHLTVGRPTPSLEFITRFPDEASLYRTVVSHGVPNYLGARAPVSHQLNIANWKKYQHCFRDKQLIDFLAYGFPVGFTGELPPTGNLANHSSAVREPVHVEKYLATEVAKLAALGPLQEPPFEQWWRNNPLMTREKRDSHDRRVILDLSFPTLTSVNCHIPRNALEGSEFKLRLPNPQQFASKVRDLGIGALMYKVDLSRAYRQLRSDPFDWAFLGVNWKGAKYIDVAIPFGLRHGASACQRTTTAVAEIAKHECGADLYPYIDDSSGAALPLSAQIHYDTLLCIMEELGLQAALAKCQGPLTTLTWVGVHFDSVTMIMSIDVDKIGEAIKLCGQFLQKQTVGRKYMEKLMGKVFYAIRCAEPAKRFTMRLLDLLRATNLATAVPVSQGAMLDATWLLAFLPHYNGRNMMKPSVAERAVFVDACPTGAGGFCRQHGFYKFLFPDHMLQYEFCIAALEAFNLLVTFRLWAPEYRGKRVIAYTDNWASVCAFNSGTAHEPLLRAVNRELWWLCAMFDVELTVRHRPGAAMEAADTLSRVDSHQQFASKLDTFRHEFGEDERPVGRNLLLPPLPL